MNPEFIIIISAYAIIIFYFVIDYRLWLRRHKKRMKKFKENLFKP